MASASSVKVQRLRPAGRRLGARRRHQQGLFLARQLAFRARTRLLAQGPLQIAFHKAALGAAGGGKADPYRSDNLGVAAAGIGRQQNLRPLQLAGGMLAAPSIILSSSRSAWLNSTR
jgi:hypothetical protein